MIKIKWERNWGQSGMWLWQPKKKTPTTQSNFVKPVAQLWKIWNSDWLMTLAIHHCNVLLLSDEWANFSREQAFSPPPLLFFHNISPKPIIVCLEANFPVTDQPMFPCIEQHCVSWLLCFLMTVCFSNMDDELSVLHFDLYLRASTGRLFYDLPDD